MEKTLQGAPVAAAMTDRLRLRAERLRDQGVVPTLAIVRVGGRPEDTAYERGARKRCQAAGVSVHCQVLPAACSQRELMNVIRQINENPQIHGCLLLRPLPAHMDERAVCETLWPEKDVDCITSQSLSAVFAGTGADFPPCTAQACLELLDHYGCTVEGKRVAVVGRSLVIGKPVAMMLTARNATVTLCHTRTRDLAERCREADILVAAAGRAGLVDETCVRPGQVVVDVGINTGPDGRLCGDCRLDPGSTAAEALSPVPGGVGSVTSTVLAAHVVTAAERRAGAPC